MLNKILLLSLIVLTLTSCGGGAEKSTNSSAYTDINTSTSTSTDNNLSLSDMDYTVRAACVNYFDMDDTVSQLSWAQTFGSQPIRMLAGIYDNSGTKELLNFFNRANPLISPAFFDTYADPVSVVSNQETRKNEQILRDNYNENILIKCIYQKSADKEQEEFNLYIPLKIREAWKKHFVHNKYYDWNKGRNDLVFEVSFLSDLFYKIYKVEFKNTNNQNLSIEKAEEFMNENFPASFYSEATLSDFVNSIPPSTKEIRIDGSLQMIYYKTLEQLATKVSSGKISLLNEAIAKEYENVVINKLSCTNPLICASFIPSTINVLTRNSDFQDGKNYWSTDTTLFGNATGESVFSNNTVTLTLQSDTPSQQQTSEISINQTFYLNESFNFDALAFKFYNERIYGYSTGFSPLAGLNSSGIAGYYTCFNDNFDNQIGCLVWGDVSNKNVGDWLTDSLYSLNSNDTGYFTNLFPTFRRLPPSNTKLNYVVMLSEELKERLPIVYARKNEISSVTYGVYVSEARSSSDNTCYKCDSYVRASEVKLIQVK